MRNLFLVFISLFPLWIACAEELPGVFTGHVVSIKDGDSIVILSQADNKRHRIYLEGIDAPEYRQDYGIKAKKKMSQITSGHILKVVPAGYTSQKELVASLYLEDGTNVSFAMVKSGCAWCLPQHKENHDLYSLQLAAQEKRVGLWKANNPVEPWIWRNHQPFTLVKRAVVKYGYSRPEDIKAIPSLK